MKLITLFMSSCILFYPTSSGYGSEGLFTLDNLFKSHGDTEGVEPRLMKAVCTVESGLRQNAKNLMDGGRVSYGLCQIQLRTAIHMGFNGNVSDLMHPNNNIKFASRYLNYQLTRYGDWKKALIAYNRGHFKRGDSTVNSYVIKVSLAYVDTRIE